MGNELVDTNILVYAVFPSSCHHGVSRSLIEKAKDPNAGLCVFPQILAEFFAVVTNPKRVSPARTWEDALQAIEQFLALPGLVVLALPADVVAHWIGLVRLKAVTGGKVFDLQIAAGMFAHGISTVYTFNTADFQGIPGIAAIEPTA